jgi:hypothetical protein
VTENDQAFDAFEAAEPGAESLDYRVVDLTVSGEWGNRCGDETSEIKGFMSFSSDAKKGPWVLAGSDAGTFASLGATAVPIACGGNIRSGSLCQKTQIVHFRYNVPV